MTSYKNVVVRNFMCFTHFVMYIAYKLKHLQRSFINLRRRLLDL
jgi:hypothetical protein